MVRFYFSSMVDLALAWRQSIKSLLISSRSTLLQLVMRKVAWFAFLLMVNCLLKLLLPRI